MRFIHTPAALGLIEAVAAWVCTAQVAVLPGGLTWLAVAPNPGDMRTAAWLLPAYLLGVLCACTAPTPKVPPVSPQGATPVGPFVPEARALFEGCTSVPESADSRTYRCGDVAVWMAEAKSGRLEDVFNRARERVTGRYGADVEEARGELPLAGGSWPSSRFAACPGADGGTGDNCRAGGYATAVTATGGRLRGLGCVARGNARPLLARCLELLEYVASHGNPEGEVLDPDALLLPPRLPWRTLAAPRGCQLTMSTTRAGRIGCGDATFRWNVYQPARTNVTMRWRNQGVAELAEALPGAGPVEEVPCRLENQPTRCARFTAPTAQGPLVVWSAAVEWEDRALFASCSFLSSEATFPAACNGAFSLP